MSEYTNSIATKLPADVFDHIARNAGVLLTDFDTETWEVDIADIIGATSGGVKFSDEIDFIDYGDDVDNCPKNMMQFKRVNTREVKLSGDFISATADMLRQLACAADLASNKITPRADISTTDFMDVWFVCDYGSNGAIALHLMNCLNTSGLAIETGDKEKAKFAFEFTAHYDNDNQDVVPYECYIKNPSSDSDNG